MKKIEVFEPWFFIFFGVFHLHRIWGIIDRKSYADFWIGIMENKGIFYYFLSFIIIPKGTKHRPVCKSLVKCLLIEVEGTLNKENTGGTYTE